MYIVVEVTSDGSARQSSINLSEHGWQKRDEGTVGVGTLASPREEATGAPARAAQASPPPIHTAPAFKGRYFMMSPGKWLRTRRRGGRVARGGDELHGDAHRVELLRLRPPA